MRGEEPVDVVLFIAAMLTYIWVVIPWMGVSPLVNSLFIVGIVSLAAFSLWRKGVPWNKVGLSSRNLSQGTAIYIGAGVSFAGLVLLYYRNSLGLMTEGWPDPRRVPMYLTWAFLQEFCFLSFLLNRFRQILRRDAAAAVTAAAIFAFFHLPNPFLTLYTLGGGLIATFLFMRWPNLVGATLAHALASGLVSNLLPPVITGWMRVGPLYWWITRGH